VLHEKEVWHLGGVNQDQRTGSAGVFFLAIFSASIKTRLIVQKNALVEGINEVLTLHMGPDFILVTLGADFVDSVSADDVERQVAELDQQLKSRFPKIKRVLIEAEKMSRRK